MKNIKSLLKTGTTVLNNNYVTLFYDTSEKNWNVATNSEQFSGGAESVEFEEKYVLHMVTNDFDDALEFFLDEKKHREFYK